MENPTSESSTYRKQRICPCNSALAHFHVSWLSNFIFYPKPLYKSLHQSFFYSFITILPSESGAVQIRAEGNNTKCVGKKRFNGSVTHGLRKELYSFITILPSESGVTLNYSTIFPYPLDTIISPYHFHFQTFITGLRENVKRFI
jgi:hypothetical protein